MLKNLLLSRLLEKELPEWVAKGWVAPEHQEALLAHVAAGKGGLTRYVPYGFYIMGVLLAGAGVIAFFAANWAGMPKLVKLALLFGAMWLAYGLVALEAVRRTSRHLVDALLLLGVILFGANIMLMAQIYHIDAHYPDGVRMWALGGLLTAYLMRSHASVIAALVLAVVWSNMEIWVFDAALHWPFLVFWAACIPAIFRNRWRGALHVAMIALLLWSLLTLFNHRALAEALGTRLLTLQVFFLAWLTIWLLAVASEEISRLPAAITNNAGTVRRYGIFGALALFYWLTFPRVHTFAGISGEAGGAAKPLGIVVTLLGLAVVAGLAVWSLRAVRARGLPPHLSWGWGLMAALLILLGINLLPVGTYAGALAAAFNVLFFATLVWLIYAGAQREERLLVNLGFAFFAVTLLSRYFDTFWALLNRSFFFLGGGLLLIGGGYLLDRQRRALLRRMAGEKEGS